MATSIAASGKSVWGFSPQSIPGLALWLDGADTTSMVFSSGSNISQWNDKSGKGNNATATGSPVLTGNSINAKQSIATISGNFFNGNISISGSTFTCFAVATTTLAMPNNTLFDQRLVSLASQGNFDFNNTNFAIGLFNQATTSTISTWRNGLKSAADITQNTPFLAVSEYDGILGVIWKNGTVGSPSSTSSTGTFAISRYGIGQTAGTTPGENWIGFIGEVIIFNAALSTIQRQQVEGYLAAKWGLGMNLPATHPYSSVIPILPTQISGCQLWLDAADSSTIIGSSPVTQWNDKSGNGRNATATGTTVTVSTLNGVPAINYDGSSWLTAPVTGGVADPFTIFIVFNASYPITGPLYTTSTTNNGTGLYVALARTSDSDTARIDFLGRGDSADNFLLNNGSTFLGNTTYVISVVSTSVNGGSITLFRNGTSYLSTTTLGTFRRTTLLIGKRNITGSTDQIAGKFGEFIVFNSAFSTLQRQQVEAYLGQKWGIGVTNTTVSPGRYLIPTNRPFYPTDITGCQLWLDTADFSSLVVAANSNITTWKDKSGNGRDATPSVSGVTADSNMNPPVYTTTPFVGASFDFTRQMATFIPAGTFSNAFSAFVIFNFTGSPQGNTNYTLLERTNIGATRFIPFSSTQFNGTIFRVIGNSTGHSFSVINGSIFTSNAQSVYYMNIASNATTTWNEGINGTMTTYSTNVNFGGTGAGYEDAGTFMNIGGRYDHAVGYSGIISEVICYNSTLTTAQRQQVEQYLGQKWGLVSSLPTGHPGKLLPAFSTNFTPKSLTGIALWLDGADRTSMVLSGTTVTQWNDKSGNTNNAVAVSTPTLSTTGAGVTLNAGNCFRVTSLTVPTTTHCLIAVHSPTTVNGTSTGNTSLFRFDQTGGYIVFPYMFSSTPRGYISSYATGGTSITFNTSPLLENSVANTPNLIVANIAASSQIVYKNGTQQNSATASIPSGTSDFLVIGAKKAGDAVANELYTGTISEILVFNTTLLNSQQQQVEGYLAWKWGLQNSLPSTHAYAKFAP